MNSSFKDKTSLNERKIESLKIRNKYPDESLS